MIGGVVIYVCIIVVQGDTMRPRATIIGVEDSEVDCLFTHLGALLALGPHSRPLHISCEERSTDLLSSTTNCLAGTKGWFKRLQVLVSK